MSHDHAPPPPPLAPLFSYQMKLVGANGQLTSLAGHRGFRKYVMVNANAMGITGTIQRYHHTDVIVKFEGCKFESSIDFLRTCRGQGMFSDFEDIVSRVAAFRFYNNFFINVDFSRDVANGGKMIKGLYSDDIQYDKQSDYSADSGIMLGSQLGAQLGKVSETGSPN